MTVINEAEFVAGNSGLPPCSNNEIISRVLGVEPVAHLSLTHIDVQIAYWRWPGGTVARFKLHQPLLAIHIAGEAQMSHRSTEKRRSYRSSCGTSTLLPSGTLVDWQFRSGGVDHLTVSLGDSAPVLCEFVAAIEAFEVVPPDPLIRELTRAIVDKLTARRRPTQDLERALGLLTETLLSRYIDRTRLHLGCKPAVSQRSSSPMEIERLIEDLPLRCGENLTVTETRSRKRNVCDAIQRTLQSAHGRHAASVSCSRTPDAGLRCLVHQQRHDSEHRDGLRLQQSKPFDDVFFTKRSV